VATKVLVFGALLLQRTKAQKLWSSVPFARASLRNQSKDRVDNGDRAVQHKAHGRYQSKG
jgi:hypothetical protein